MISIDLKEEMRDLRDTWLQLCKAKVEKNESFPITFVVLCTRDPKTHQPWNEPQAVLYIPREDDDDGKDEAGMIIKAIAISGRAIAVMHLADAWVSKASHEEMMDPNRPRPKDHPNRREAVVTHIEMKHAEITIASQHFYKTENGKFIEWEETKEDEIPLKDHRGRLIAIPRHEVSERTEFISQKICQSALAEMDL